MKTNISNFASRLAILLLAVCMTLSFAACSNDDSSDTNIDDILSKETTPIDFQLKEFYDRYKNYIIFDYAGDSYIGTDTLKSRTGTFNLRQGKHHLLFIKGLYNNTYLSPNDMQKDFGKWYKGFHYDPLAKTITYYGDFYDGSSITYSEKDLEVFPYLLPVQEIDFDKFITAQLCIEISDLPNNPIYPEWNSNYECWDDTSIGIIKGSPIVSTVSINSNSYKTKDSKFGLIVDVYADTKYYHEKDLPKDKLIYYVRAANLLCPRDGLDNIQLSVDIRDSNGQTVPTTTLPKVSLRRGCRTILRGPLFTGSTSDWKCEFEPMKTD